MKKLLILSTVAVFIALNLTGCGTTQKLSEDNTTNDEVTIAQKSTALEVDNVVLENYGAGEQYDNIHSRQRNAAIPGATIEVYLGGYPYSESNYLGNCVVAEDGTFSIDIPNNDSGYEWNVFSVFQLEQGKRQSNAILLMK